LDGLEGARMINAVSVSDSKSKYEGVEFAIHLESRRRRQSNKWGEFGHASRIQSCGLQVPLISDLQGIPDTSIECKWDQQDKRREGQKKVRMEVR